MTAPSLDLALHPKQGLAFQSAASEILYGGAAGGGKSYLMRAAAVVWACEIAGLQIYMFRRVMDDLIRNHVEGPKGFRALLAPLVDSGHASIIEDEIRFWNGSKIYLCHCKDEAHRFKYQGAEIHVLLIDEAGHFTPTIYRFLRSRLRAVGLGDQGSLAGRLPLAILSANPGGIGHQFLAEGFITPKPPLEVWRAPDVEGGMLRQFIPAKMEDNPSLLEDDPSYRSKLRGLGSAALVRALELGDWSVVDGAYFDCWSPALIVPPFEVPRHWLKFRALDWGSFRPFSVGWWTVAGEDRVDIGDLGVPKGALIRYREWYGAKSANQGLKLDAETVALRLRTLEAGEEIAYGVAGTDLFQSNGGPSLAERMSRVGVHFRAADTKRQAGWDRLRRLMVGIDGAPLIYCASTCRDSIRTIPALQHDEARPEDLDSDGEDHAADEWRYAAMSRPWTQELPVAPAPKFLHNASLDDLWKWRERELRQERGL